MANTRHSSTSGTAVARKNYRTTETPMKFELLVGYDVTPVQFFQPDFLYFN